MRIYDLLELVKRCAELENYIHSNPIKPPNWDQAFILFGHVGGVKEKICDVAGSKLGKYIHKVLVELDNNIDTVYGSFFKTLNVLRLIKSWKEIDEIDYMDKMYNSLEFTELKVEMLRADLIDFERKITGVIKNRNDAYLPKAASNSADSQTVQESECEYKFEFYKTNDTWKVSYENEHAEGLKDLRGMQLIAEMLKFPNDTRGLSPNRTEFGSDDVLDEEALRDCANSIKELEKDLEKAEENKDSEQITRINAEMCQIREFVNKSRGKGGEQRKNSIFERDKAAKKAMASIRYAIKHLRNRKLHRLADHLNSIRSDSGFIFYWPGKIPPRWQLR